MHDGPGPFFPIPSPAITVRPACTEDLPRMIAMYIACFAEAPWLEVFTEPEVQTDFDHIRAMSRSIFLVVCEGNQVVGAAIGFPVAEKPEVQEDIPAEDRESFYVAEIFIDRPWRNRLLSLAVTQKLLHSARIFGFTRYSVRTSVGQPRIVRLFTDHFEGKEVARQNVRSMKCINGTMQEMPDTRILMTGPIR